MTTDHAQQDKKTAIDAIEPAQRVSIVMLEVPLKMGVLDNLLWGKDASHTYLALKDAQTSQVISEIHGTTYDARYDRLAAGIAGSVRSLIGIGVQKFETHHLFNRAAQALGLDDFFIRLRAKATDGLWRSCTQHKEELILQGSAQEILPRWNDLIRAAQVINQADLIYTPFGTPLQPGQNCHSVTSDLIEILGHTPPQETLYARPGYERALSETLADIAQIAASALQNRQIQNTQGGQNGQDQQMATPPAQAQSQAQAFSAAVKDFKSLIATTDASIRTLSGFSASITSPAASAAPASPQTKEKSCKQRQNTTKTHGKTHG